MTSYSPARSFRVRAAQTGVLIVDSHPILGQALAALLAQVDDIVVLGTATSVDSAVAMGGKLNPEVVIVGGDLGTASATVLVERLRDSDDQPATIFLSPSETADDAEPTAPLGGSGLVLREASLDDLIAAIHWAVAGDFWMSPMTLTSLIAEIQARGRSAEPAVNRELTPREGEILELLVEGLGIRTIAERLNLSLNTVRTHTRNIQMKLNVHSNIEAVSIALGRGARPS